MVRLFSPQLTSVKGSNTNLQLLKLKENNLVADISDNSGFEVESLNYHFNNLMLKASDSTEITFEISPALKKVPTGSVKRLLNKIPVTVRGWDAFHINRLKATISGTSFIDVGHAQIDSIQMQVSDTSAIILSGGTMKKLHLDPSIFSQDLLNGKH